MKGALRQPETDREDPAGYRTPMTVAELVIFPSRGSYYLCPRCRATLDREFAAYCDRCGQCLNWREYRRAKRIRSLGNRAGRT